MQCIFKYIPLYVEVYFKNIFIYPVHDWESIKLGTQWEETGNEKSFLNPINSILKIPGLFNSPSVSVCYCRCDKKQTENN